MIPGQSRILGAPAISLNGSAPPCEHLDGLAPVTPQSDECPACRGPGRPLGGTSGLPDLRLGGLFRRLTEPARQGALRGDRPPARPPSGAGIAVAMVLRPPASGLTRLVAARPAGFMPQTTFFIRLLEYRSEHERSDIRCRVRRRRAFPRGAPQRPDVPHDRFTPSPEPPLRQVDRLAAARADLQPGPAGPGPPSGGTLNRAASGARPPKAVTGESHRRAAGRKQHTDRAAGRSRNRTWPRCARAAAAAGRQAPAAPWRKGPADRGAGRSGRGRIRVRRPAFRVLPQRVGQHASEDVATGPAGGHRSRGQHGLVLVHDLRGAAIDTAASGRGGQPRLQRGGEHAARRRCPRPGSQLGDAVQLAGQHSGVHALHPGIGHLECFCPPGPAGPRPGRPGDGSPARCWPDRRGGRGPGIARRLGGRARLALAQRVLRSARARRCSAH
jgi:hypothetical protein